MKTTTAYHEVFISPAPSGFGMYQSNFEHGPESTFSDHTDLLELIASSVEYMHIDEALNDPEFIAAGVDDIRGKIYNGDPTELYAYIVDKEHGNAYVKYFGVEQIEVAENYWD